MFLKKTLELNIMLRYNAKSKAKLCGMFAFPNMF